jgi:starch synthase
MNILLAASEMTPYAKTGGLGDVLAALPPALRAQGHSVSVVLPLYRNLKESFPRLKPSSLVLRTQLGGLKITARVWSGVADSGVTVFAVEREEYYDRSHLYGGATGDYFDNAARFIFFSKMVVELARYIDPEPEVLHLHDWQTALVPALVKEAGLPYKTVLTIHNLAYQGIFPDYEFNLTHLSTDWFKVDALEFYGRMNLLKGGILAADEVTTVSPSYAEEILTSRFGCGLENVLQTRAGQLTGILNGIDAASWDPSRDPWIEQTYDARSLEKKQECKKALLKELGLDMSGQEPLVGCISRLVEQKGFELVLEVMPELLEYGAAFVLLGSGEPFYEKAFLKLAQDYPGQVAVIIGFDEGLAHRIEAGVDLFLMPSLFEPCGLNQMYSQRYGTIPVVHDLGGLSDSVEAWNGVEHHGTGFKFKRPTAESFWEQLHAALELMKDREAWNAIRFNAMRRDFSWEKVVPGYEEVYKKVLAEV